MKNSYKNKIKKGLELLNEIMNNMNESNNDTVNEYRYDLFEVENLLEYPFQTIPASRYIQITTSFCDPDGSAYKSHDDTISFNREISTAMLYSMLKEHVQYYDPSYTIQADLAELEEWLNTQQGLLQTVDQVGYEAPTIEDTGLTVFDIKTEFGSIDVFIEYGISFREETQIWNME